jgi:RNA recognition motif-containing protein
MAVLNLIEEGSNGNKTSLYLETRTSRFAKEDLQNTTFKPYMWKGRKADSLDTKKNPRKEKTMLIYVWNLSPNVSEDFFCQTFEAFGQVSFAIISSTNLKDRDNGQLRRFAFVEMPHQSEARAAIKNLNRKALLGQRMIVYASSEN